MAYADVSTAFYHWIVTNKNNQKTKMTLKRLKLL